MLDQTVFTGPSERPHHRLLRGYLDCRLLKIIVAEQAYV